MSVRFAFFKKTQAKELLEVWFRDSPRLQWICLLFYIHGQQIPGSKLSSDWEATIHMQCGEHRGIWKWGWTWEQALPPSARIVKKSRWRRTQRRLPRIHAGAYSRWYTCSCSMCAKLLPEESGKAKKVCMRPALVFKVVQPLLKLYGEYTVSSICSYLGPFPFPSLSAVAGHVSLDVKRVRRCPCPLPFGWASPLPPPPHVLEDDLSLECRVSGL